ncbi:transposase [Pseudomonas sp. PDM32]|nr:transposase [Pseudomonas sp. PDM32]
MGTITVRKRKDGSAAYTALIRIMQKGVTVYQESQTFDCNTTTQVWLKRRETELAESGAIAKANRKGVTVKELIERYRVCLLTANALIASIGDAKGFKKGRQLAAWSDLMPRQHSGGAKPTLSGMNKREGAYLRTLMAPCKRLR